MYRCIAFDVDGTMIDTEHMVISTLKIILKEELGKSFLDKELKIAIGMQAEKTLEHFGVSEESGALDRWYRYMGQSRDKNRCFDGIEETLVKVREAGYLMVVVTNRMNFEIKSDPLFDRIGGYFDGIVCGSDVEHLKPAPDMMLELMKRYQLNKEEILFIGDTIHDSHCAAAAKVDFALAGWGASNPDEIPAKYALLHPDEITELLLQIPQGGCDCEA